MRLSPVPKQLWQSVKTTPNDQQLCCFYCLLWGVLMPCQRGMRSICEQRMEYAHQTALCTLARRQKSPTAKITYPKKEKKTPSKFEYSNEEAGRVRHHIKYSALILVFFVVPSSLTCRMEGNGARVGGMQIQNIMFCINYTFRLRATENMFCVAFANSQLLWLCDTPSALPRSVDMTIKTASVIFELLNGIFCHILRFYVEPLAYATQSTNGYATYGEINSAIWHRRQEEKKNTQRNRSCSTI